MDVRCPQCNTLYELDEKQASRGAVTLKCSRCQHVFRFETKAAISQENQRRWMINSSEDGAVLYLTDLADLHRWIMEKKVSRDDTISRTGERWVRLGSIPEFAPIFIVVDSIADLTGSPEDSHIATRVREGTPAEPPAPSQPQAEAPSQRQQPQAQPSPPKTERERVKTNVQFPNATAPRPTPSRPASEEPTRNERPTRPTRPTPGELPPRPRPNTDTGERAAPRIERTPNPANKSEWSIGTESRPEPASTATTDFPRTEEPSSRGALFVVVIILLLAGGGAAVYFARPDLVEPYLDQFADPDPVVALGETDEPDAAAEPDSAAVVEEPVEPNGIVATALVAARTEADAREAAIFEGAVFAANRPLGTAIDMAQTRATKAAEGGLVDEQLADAQKALERGRLRDASELFEAILDVEPRNADATAGLGFIYLERSNPKRAASQFRKAIDLGGGDGAAYIGLGTVERQLGNTQAAYDAYDLYLGRFPRGEKASIARYQLDQLRKQLGM